MKIYLTTPVSCISKLSSYVTMSPDFFIVIFNEIFNYLTRVTWLRLFFLFFTQDQIFVKVFIHYSFTILTLFKNCFNKFISSIFISKSNYWLGKFIINTNKFVNKTTWNVIFILFWVRSLISFNAFWITLKISINWNCYLFKIILKLSCSFF